MSEKPSTQTTPSEIFPGKYWSVSVAINGENVVTIERDCLSGREIGPDEEEAIRTAARHLLAFIGDPT